MTPKEKAKELVDSMYHKIWTLWEQHWDAVHYDIAKQCALIAVEEIIKETKLHDKTIHDHVRTGYWLEVKQELLTL